MIKILTLVGEFELGRGDDSPPITEENIDTLAEAFEDYKINMVGLSDGSSLILSEGLREVYAIRVYLDTAPPPAPDALLAAVKKALVCSKNGNPLEVQLHLERIITAHEDATQ